MSSNPSVSLRGEIAGGVAGAVVAFAMAVPLGTLAFAPLGGTYTGTGVAAGLVGAAAGSFVTVISGRNPVFRNGPMTALCLIMSAVIGTAAGLPGVGGAVYEGIPAALGVALLCVMLAGLVQVAFGLLRLGHVMRFVPRPVLAGFRTSLAALIIVSQLPVLLGGWDVTAVLPPPWSGQGLPWSFAVAGAGITAIVLVRYLHAPSLALFTGLAAATIAHHAISRAYGTATLGPVVGRLPELAELPAALRILPDLGALIAQPGIAGAIVSPALGMAVVGAVLSLVAARMLDEILHTHTGSNRELVGQGLANVASALFGGVPGAVSPTTTISSHSAGARGRSSAIVTSVLLVAALAVAAPWIAQIPLTALAAVMLAIAYDLIDPEVARLVAQVRQGDSAWDESAADLAVIGAVALVSLAANLLAGVAVGVAISIAIFVVRSSRKIVRRHADARTRTSLRQRTEADRAILSEQGGAIALLELEGAIFFGNADRLAADVQQTAPDARFVILDCGRVTTIDATGAHAIAQLAHALRQSDGALLVAGLGEHDRRRASLSRNAPAAAIAWHPDADRALEWCEDQLLQAAGLQVADIERPVESMELFRTLDAREIAALKPLLVREFHRRGTLLFRENDPGDRLYLLARGRVSMMLREPGQSQATKRVVTFAPGVVFGEMAILQGRERSADAICDDDTVTHALTQAALAELSARDPHLAIKLYRALAQTLSMRLRATTQELRALASR